MRYNEFKKPQLTEEQIVLDYCLGEITKEDAVLHLNEKNPLDAFNKLKGIGSKLYSKGKDFFKGTKRGVQGKPQTGGKGGGSIPKTPASGAGFNTGKKIKGAAPVTIGAGFGATAVSALDTEPKTAQADEPVKKTDIVKPKVPAPKPAVKNKERPPVKATAANTRDYDKTMALQKKLIAGGAKIKADGLMGPNTRAAMKAAGMSPKPTPKPTAKPTAKPKPMPKRMDPMEPGDNYRKPASDKIPGMKLAYTAKPTAKTPAAPVPQVPAQKKKQSGRGIIGGTVAAIKRSNQRNRKKAAADYKNNPNKKVTIPGTNFSYKPLQDNPNDIEGGMGA